MEKLLIGVTGVIIGAAITWIKELWSDYRKREKEATYIAIRTVSILENFFDGCVDVALDDGYEDEQGCHQPSIKAPSISFDDLVVNWESLPFETLYSILNFPSEVKQAEDLINSTLEYVAFPPDYEEYHTERHLQYSNLGLAAFELAAQLRKQYKMPQKKFKYWNPIERLQTRKAETLEYIEDRKSQTPIPAPPPPTDIGT